jgi:hypothetical protein
MHAARQISEQMQVPLCVKLSTIKMMANPRRALPIKRMYLTVAHTPNKRGSTEANQDDAVSMAREALHANDGWAQFVLLPVPANAIRFRNSSQIRRYGKTPYSQKQARQIGICEKVIIPLLPDEAK